MPSKPYRHGTKAIRVWFGSNMGTVQQFDYQSFSLTLILFSSKHSVIAAAYVRFYLNLYINKSHANGYLYIAILC